MSVPPDPARQALDRLAARVPATANAERDYDIVYAALAAVPPSPPKGMCDCGADQVLRGDRVYPALNPDCPVHGTPSPPLIEALEAAKDAINTCDGPCGSAWQVVVAALAAARGETREEPMC